MKEGCLERKARIVGIVAVSVLFMSAVVIRTPTVLAATDHPYLIGLGQTWVTNSALDASVSDGVPPLQIDVEDGDSVTVYYNYSYSDYRTTGSYKAYHTFNLTVYYAGPSSNGAQHETDPNDGYNVGSVSVHVNNVAENTYIWVNYTATITCDDVSPNSDSANNGESIYLY